MKKPVLQGSQVEIVRSGQFYTLLLGKDISLTWDKGTRLLVHISATYRVLMCSIIIYDGTLFHSILYNTCTFFVCRAVYVVCVVTLMEMSTMT